MPSSLSVMHRETAQAVLGLTDAEMIAIESIFAMSKNARTSAKTKQSRVVDICKNYGFQGFMYYNWLCLLDEGALNMKKGGGKGGRRTRSTQVLSFADQLAHVRKHQEEIGANLGQLRDSFLELLEANDESCLTPANARSARGVDASVKLHLRLSALFASWTDDQDADIGDEVADYMASLVKEQVRENQELCHYLSNHIIFERVDVDSNFGLVYQSVPKNEIGPGESPEDVDPGKCNALKVFLFVDGQGPLDIEREIFLMKVTSGSPFSVDVTLTSANKRLPFVLMEWMGGGSLSELIEKVPDHLRKEDAPLLTMYLCAGLVYLKLRNIGHRDIKPDK
jgi:hypothetical protein